MWAAPSPAPPNDPRSQGSSMTPNRLQRRRRGRVAAALTMAVLLAFSVAACGSSSSSSDDSGGGKATLTLYSGQHEALTKALTEAFEKESGIHINVRSGEDAAMVNQIVEEGARSKADLVMTEEPGPIDQIDAKNLLAPVDAGTLKQVDARFVPSSHNWVPYAARSRVMFYNPSLIAENELPKSILDLTDPKWKGKFAYAPSGAFVATVNYLINTIGADKTLTWLEGIKANGANEQQNGTVRDSVEAGRYAFGLSNHYYWYILAEQKGGPDKLASKVHYLPGKDAGGIMLASGAAVLKSSKHQAEAQQFLAWLTRADGGQQIIATGSPQYPVAPGVNSTKGLPPLSQLDPPEFDQGSLGDITKARDLITKAGIT
jgi:iron(III) transport system substrate-binding protein